MGKEKFVRSKPHVNAPESEESFADPSLDPSYGKPMESLSLSADGGAQAETELFDLPGGFKAPPELDEAGHIPSESFSLNFAKIEFESGLGGDGSTMVELEPGGPGGYGGPDSLAGLGEVEDHGLLLPAIQKVREAAARMESEDPLEIEADF